jgi:hypothetical protein
VGRLEWQPPRYRRLLYLGGGVALALLAALGDRGPLGLGSGLPLAIVAVLLLGLAALDVWFGCPLAADGRGLQLSHGPGRVEVLPWSAVQRVEASSATHRGLILLSSLEIDLGDRLILLSRHRLGHDPAIVADQLSLVRPP